MKKFFTFFVTTLVAFFNVVPAFATYTTGPVRTAIANTKDGSAGAMREEKLTGNLQDRAEKEITRRIESLNKLISRINEFKKLTAAQKTTLTTEVQGQITALNTLLAKIKADTDTTTLKTDVQSIVSSYRIFALFMPKIQIIGAADRLLTVADNMSSQAAKLQTKITEAKNAGTDTTGWDTLLSDMNTKIADAKTQAQGAIDAVTPLTPDGYPGNKTTLQNARQMVVTALHDLNDARQDGRKIIVAWVKGTKPSGTPEASPTP